MAVKRPSAVVTAACVLGAAGMIAGGIQRFRLADRYVTVKGVAERDVAADVGIWPLRFTSADNDLDRARLEDRELLGERPSGPCLELGARHLDGEVGLPRGEHRAVECDVLGAGVGGDAGDVPLDRGQSEPVALELLDQLEPRDLADWILADRLPVRLQPSGKPSRPIWIWPSASPKAFLFATCSKCATR